MLEEQFIGFNELASCPCRQVLSGNPEFCAWVTLKEEHTFEGVGNTMTKLGRSRNLPEEDLLLAQLGVKAAR